MNLLTMLPLGLVELALNQLLALDDDTPARLKPMVGKRLRLTLTELGQPLTVSVFEDHIALASADTDAVDCAIRTRIAVLPELRDSANITRLIKADALDIDGDPMLAQQLSQLIRELDIDWEAQLAARIGDVAAHWVSQLWQRSEVWLKQQVEDQQDWLKGALLEEYKVLAGKPEFDVLRDDVQQLRAAIDRLERQAAKVLTDQSHKGQ